MKGHISEHARRRAREMKIDIADVIQCLADPEVTYEQPARGAGYMMYQRGDLAVAVLMRADGSPVALSVLYRTQDTYERGEKS